MANTNSQTENENGTLCPFDLRLYRCQRSPIEMNERKLPNPARDMI